jgi:Papain-like cysteine protease AvrRpt2
MSSVLDKTRIDLFPGDGEAVTLRVEAEPVLAPLSFHMQQSCFTNWCWAAVGVSVALYYDVNCGVKQCTLANRELQRSDCCSTPCHVDTVAFNVTNSLGSTLNRVRCLDRAVRMQVATRSEVRDELRAGRPVCARMAWAGGGAHFVTIIHFDPVTDTLVIEDPFFGRMPNVSFNQFCSHYSDQDGRWVDTYFTRSSSIS